MIGKMGLFILLLIINIVIVILYLLWERMHKKDNRRGYLFKAGMMCICPIVGPIFLFLTFVFLKVFMSGNVDLEDVIFSKDRVETNFHPDEERERNMVSLEEALAITDKSNLRRLMLNVIKGDYRNVLAKISKALNSDDSETSHYAAAVLQEVLNEFRLEVQRKQIKCQDEEEDQAGACVELIEYMDPILRQKVFTDMEQRSMIDIMEETGERLYRSNPEAISSEIYEILSMRLLEIEEYKKCQKWCERAMDQYPKILESYSCLLKVAFAIENRTLFFETMDRLKQSDIVIDHETLELIRIFM